MASRPCVTMQQGKWQSPQPQAAHAAEDRAAAGRSGRLAAMAGRGVGSSGAGAMCGPAGAKPGMGNGARTGAVCGCGTGCGAGWAAHGGGCCSAGGASHGAVSRDAPWPLRHVCTPMGSHLPAEASAAEHAPGPRGACAGQCERGGRAGAWRRAGSMRGVARRTERQTWGCRRCAVSSKPQNQRHSEQQRPRACQ